MTSLDGPLLPASDAKYFHPLQRYIRLTRQERWTWEIKASSKHGFYSLLIIPFFFFLLSISKVALGRVKPAGVSGIKNPCYWFPLGTHALLAGLCEPKEGQQFVGSSLLGDLFQSSDTVC